MATPTQIQFKLDEVTRLLLKAENITEGRWFVSFEFNFTAGNVGQGPDDTKPAAIVQIAAVALSKAPENMNLPYIVDAAKTD